jgi:hypothetical protein
MNSWALTLRYRLAKVVLEMVEGHISGMSAALISDHETA